MRRLIVRALCAALVMWLASAGAADSPSMKKAIEKAMQMMEKPNRGNQ